MFGGPSFDGLVQFINRSVLVAKPASQQPEPTADHPSSALITEDRNIYHVIKRNQNEEDTTLYIGFDPLKPQVERQLASMLSHDSWYFVAVDTHNDEGLYRSVRIYREKCEDVEWTLDRMMESVKKGM